VPFGINPCLASNVLFLYSCWRDNEAFFREYSAFTALSTYRGCVKEKGRKAKAGIVKALSRRRDRARSNGRIKQTERVVMNFK